MQKKKSGFKLLFLAVLSTICLAIVLPSLYFAIDNKGSFVNESNFNYTSANLDSNNLGDVPINSENEGEGITKYEPASGNAVIVFSSKNFLFLDSYKDKFSIDFRNIIASTVTIPDGNNNKSIDVFVEKEIVNSGVSGKIDSFPVAYEVGNPGLLNNINGNKDAREFAIVGSTQFSMCFNVKVDGNEDNLSPEVNAVAYDKNGSAISLADCGISLVKNKVYYKCYFYENGKSNDKDSVRTIYLDQEPADEWIAERNNYFENANESYACYTLSGDYAKFKYLSLGLTFNLEELPEEVKNAESEKIKFILNDNSSKDTGVSGYKVDVALDFDGNNLYQNVGHIVSGNEIYDLQEKFVASGDYIITDYVGSRCFNNKNGERDKINLELNPRLVKLSSTKDLNKYFISRFNLQIEDRFDNNASREFNINYVDNALKFMERSEISVASGTYWQSATSILKLGEEEKEIKIVVYLNSYTNEVEVEISSEHNLGEFEFSADFSVNEISGKNILSVKKPYDDQHDNNQEDDESYFGVYFYEENVNSHVDYNYKNAGDMFKHNASVINSNDLDCDGKQDSNALLYNFGSSETIEFIVSNTDYIFDKIVIKDASNEVIFTIYGGLYVSDGTSTNYFFNSELEDASLDDDHVYRGAGNKDKNENNDNYYAYYIEYNDQRMNNFPLPKESNDTTYGVYSNRSDDGFYYSNNFFELEFTLGKIDAENGTKSTPVIKITKENVCQNLTFEVSTQIYSLLVLKENKAQEENGVHNYTKIITQKPYSSVIVSGKSYVDDSSTSASELLLGYATFGMTAGAGYVVSVTDKYMFVNVPTSKTQSFAGLKGFEEVVAVAKSTNSKIFNVEISLQDYLGNEINLKTLEEKYKNNIVDYLRHAIEYSKFNDGEKENSTSISYTDVGKLVAGFYFTLASEQGPVTSKDVTAMFKLSDASYLTIVSSSGIKYINEGGLDKTETITDGFSSGYSGIKKDFSYLYNFKNDNNYKTEVKLTLRFMSKQDVKVKYIAGTTNKEVGTVDIITGFTSDYSTQDAKVYYYKESKPESGAHSDDYLLSAKNTPQTNAGVYFAGLSFENSDNNYIVHKYNDNSWVDSGNFANRFFVGDYSAEKFATDKTESPKDYTFVGKYYGSDKSLEHFNERFTGQTIADLVEMQGSAYVYVLTGYEKYNLIINYIDQDDVIMGSRDMTLYYASTIINLGSCEPELAGKLKYSSLDKVVYNNQPYVFSKNVNPAEAVYELSGHGFAGDLNDEVSGLSGYSLNKNSKYDATENNQIFIRCELNEYDFGVWVGNYNEYTPTAISSAFKKMSDKVKYGYSVNFSEYLNAIVVDAFGEDVEKTIEDLISYRGARLVGFVPVYTYKTNVESAELTQLNVKNEVYPRYIFVNDKSEVSKDYKFNSDFIKFENFDSTTINLNAVTSIFNKFSYSLEGFSDTERDDYAIMFIPVFEAKEYKINFESDVQFGSFGSVNYNGTNYSSVKNAETNIDTLTISVKFASKIDITKPIPKVVGGYIFKGYKLILSDEDRTITECEIGFTGFNSNFKAQSMNSGDLIFSEKDNYFDEIITSNPHFYRWDMIEDITFLAVYEERPIVVNIGGITAEDYELTDPENQIIYNSHFDFTGLEENIVFGDNNRYTKPMVRGDRNLWMISTEDFKLNDVIRINGFLANIKYDSGKNIFDSGYYLSKYVIKYYYYDYDEEGNQVQYIVEIETPDGGKTSCISIATYRCDITGNSVLESSSRISLGTSETVGVNFSSKEDVFKFKLPNLLQMTELTDKNVYMLEVGCVFDELTYVVSFNPGIFSMDKGSMVTQELKDPPAYYLVPFNGRHIVKNWQLVTSFEEDNAGNQFAVVDDPEKTLFDFELKMTLGEGTYTFNYAQTIYFNDTPFTVTNAGTQYYLSHWASEGSGMGLSGSGILPYVTASSPTSIDDAVFDITKLETPVIGATGIIELYPVFLFNTHINAQYYTWNTLAGMGGTEAYNIYSTYGAGFSNGQTTTISAKIPYNIYKMDNKYYFIDHWFGVMFKYVAESDNDDINYSVGINAILKMFANGASIYTVNPNDISGCLEELNENDDYACNGRFTYFPLGEDNDYKIYPGQRLADFEAKDFEGNNSGAVYYFVLFGVYEEYVFTSKVEGGNVVINANLPSTPTGERYDNDGSLQIEYVFGDYSSYEIAKDSGDIRFADGLYIKDYIDVGTLDEVNANTVVTKYLEHNAGDKRILYAVVKRSSTSDSKPYFALPIGIITPDEVFKYGVFVDYGGPTNASGINSKYTSILTTKVNPDKQALIDFRSDEAQAKLVGGTSLYGLYVSSREQLYSAYSSGIISDDEFNLRLLVVEIALQLIYYGNNQGYGYFSNGGYAYNYPSDTSDPTEHHNNFYDYDNYSADVSVLVSKTSSNLTFDIKTVIDAINNSTETSRKNLYTDCMGFIRMLYTLVGWSVCETIGETVNNSNIEKYNGVTNYWFNTVGGSFSYARLNAENQFLPTTEDAYMFNFAGENMFGPGLHSDESMASASKNIGILPGDTIFDRYKDKARHVVLYLFGSGNQFYSAEYGSASVYKYSYDESTNSFYGKGLSSNPYHFQYYVDMTGSAFNDNKDNESA